MDRRRRAVTCRLVFLSVYLNEETKFLATQEKGRFKAAASYLALGAGTAFWSAAALLWQFTQGRSDTGRTFLMGFLLVLLVGGILLLARGIRDLLVYRKPSKPTTGIDRKKAA